MYKQRVKFVSGKTSSSRPGLRRQQVRDIVKSMVPVEVKAAGSTLSGLIPAGTVTFISGIAVDDTVATRTGDMIFVKAIELFGRVIDPNANNTVRIIVFRDLMCQGALPGTTDVVAANTHYSVYHYVNVEQMKRFQVLSDVRYDLSIQGRVNRSFHVIIPVNKQLHYTGTSNAIGHAGKGSLFIQIIPETAASASMSIDYRVRFTDA